MEADTKCWSFKLGGWNRPWSSPWESLVEVHWSRDAFGSFWQVHTEGKYSITSWLAMVAFGQEMSQSVKHIWYCTCFIMFSYSNFSLQNCLYMWLWNEWLIGMLKNCTAFQGEMYSAFSKRVFGSSRQVAFCKDARRTVMPSADGFYTSWPIPVFKRLYMYYRSPALAKRVLQFCCFSWVVAFFGCYSGCGCGCSRQAIAK